MQICLLWRRGEQKTHLPLPCNFSLKKNSSGSLTCGTWPQKLEKRETGVLTHCLLMHYERLVSDKKPKAELNKYFWMVQGTYLKCRAGFDWVEVNFGHSDGLATFSTRWDCSLRNSCPYAFCLRLQWLPTASCHCLRWNIPEVSVRDLQYWRQFICVVRRKVVIWNRLCHWLCNRLERNLSIRFGESGGYDEIQKSLCIFKRRHIAKGYSHRTSGTSIN